MLGQVMTTKDQASSELQHLSADAQVVLVELLRRGRQARASEWEVAHDDLCKATQLSSDRVAEAVAELDGDDLVEVFDADPYRDDRNVYVLAAQVPEEVAP